MNSPMKAPISGIKRMPKIPMKSPAIVPIKAPAVPYFVAPAFLAPIV